MGWGSGSELAENIWSAVSKYIPDDKKREVAIQICNYFKDKDCDTLYEAEELYEAAYGMTEIEILDYIEEVMADPGKYQFMPEWLQEQEE